MFEVRFASECANGHPLKKGDYAAYSLDAPEVLLCPQCPDFQIRYGKPEKIFSHKACAKCFIELPIVAVDECPNCEMKITDKNVIFLLKR